MSRATNILPLLRSMPCNVFPDPKLLPAVLRFLHLQTGKRNRDNVSEQKNVISSGTDILSHTLVLLQHNKTLILQNSDHIQNVSIKVRNSIIFFFHFSIRKVWNVHEEVEHLGIDTTLERPIFLAEHVFLFTLNIFTCNPGLLRKVPVIT